MLTSFLFLAAIVVASIVIAVVADNLGRKLGKKRLTLGRMRPRHVATLFTGLMGAVVSLVTIGLVSLASKDVRTWIIEGQQAIQDVQRLRVQQDSLSKTVEQLDGRVGTLNQEIATKTAQAKDANDRLAAATARLVALRKQLEAANRQTSAARGQAKQLLASVRQLQRSVSGQKELLAKSRKDLDATRNTARRATGDYQRTLRDYNDLVANRDALDKALAKMEADVDALNKQISSRTEEIARITGEKDDLAANFNREKAAYERAKTAYEGDLDSLRKDLVDAQTELQQIGQILALNRDASRLSPMIFRYREELTRVSIDPSRTRVEAQKIVQDAILRSRQVARNRGAKTDGVSAGLFDLRDTDGALLATVEEQESQWANLIAGKADPLVLLVRSKVNAFAGEFVSLEFSVLRNPIIYRANQVIADARVDGGASEQSILRQVEDFIQNKLKDKVKEDGMIPVQGEDESFGSVSSETVLALVRTLKAEGRAVRLLAKAKTDTRAGDILALLFDYK